MEWRRVSGAGEGVRGVGAVEAQGCRKGGGGRDGFKATGIAYVRFAHDEPALFRLSFTRQMPERKGQEAGDGGEIAYNLLRAAVGEVFPSAESADAAPLHARALVPGLALLLPTSLDAQRQAMYGGAVRPTL